MRVVDASERIRFCQEFNASENRAISEYSSSIEIPAEKNAIGWIVLFELSCGLLLSASRVIVRPTISRT